MHARFLVVYDGNKNDNATVQRPALLSVSQRCRRFIFLPRSHHIPILMSDPLVSGPASLQTGPLEASWSILKHLEAS